MATYFLNKEVQINESADENEQAFVSASGTSQVYPTWVAKEVADGIDPIRRKDSPPELSWQARTGYPYNINSRLKISPENKRPINS